MYDLHATEQARFRTVRPRENLDAQVRIQRSYTRCPTEQQREIDFSLHEDRIFGRLPSSYCMGHSNKTKGEPTFDRRRRTAWSLLQQLLEHAAGCVL